LSMALQLLTLLIYDICALWIKQFVLFASGYALFYIRERGCWSQYPRTLTMVRRTIIVY
jgi:ABC-type proline/glycine betaine transport system permease subunit